MFRKSKKGKGHSYDVHSKFLDLNKNCVSKEIRESADYFTYKYRTNKNSKPDFDRELESTDEMSYNRKHKRGASSRDKKAKANSPGRKKFELSPIKNGARSPKSPHPEMGSE